MADPLNAKVAVRDLRVSRGRVLAIAGVSARFSAGRWHGLIGANGSGKTSLLRAIAGRLPIDSGDCLVGDVDLTADRPARARAIGFAPSADMLPPSLLVRDVLAIAAGSRKVPATLPPSITESLEISRLLDRPVGFCSAGMRQRVAVACAFAEGTDIVVLDEPFNWLDPVAAYELRGALRTLVREGLTLITALHDLTTLALSCDEATLLADGGVKLALSQDDMAAAANNPVAFERRTIDLLRSNRPASRSAR